MTKNFRCLVAGAAMAIFFPIAAEAAPAGIVCKLQQFGGDGHSSGTVDLTFAYDGGATGALSATTPWGALNLPSPRRDDCQRRVWYQRSGEATLLMPDQTALDACLTAKAKPADLADKDVLALLVNACSHQVAGGKAPVPVTVHVEISGIDGDVTGFVSRKFAAASGTAGVVVEVATFPPMPYAAAP